MKSNPGLAFLLAVYLIRPHLYGPLVNENMLSYAFDSGLRVVSIG